MKLLLIAEFTYKNSYYLTISITPFKAYIGKDPLLNYKFNNTDSILEGEVLATIERV